MITIIFAKPGVGKTAYMTYLVNELAFDKARKKIFVDSIQEKNQNGFKLSIPEHCIYANYEIKLTKYGYRPRMSYRINPFRLGYANAEVRTHFLPSYSVIAITEGQKYFNSRMSLYYPDWQSRFFEQHRHNNLDIFIDVQRPYLIDLNIRELATFIEIISMTKCYKKGKLNKLKFRIKYIEDSKVLDNYYSSGGSLNLPEKEIVVNYNALVLYDSQNCKPMFFAGHFNEDFDFEESQPPANTINSYVEYLERVDDELPKGFYQKRKNI